MKIYDPTADMKTCCPISLDILSLNFDNGIFIPKYYKSSFIPADICTKPSSGPIIGWSNKLMAGFSDG